MGDAIFGNEEGDGSGENIGEAVTLTSEQWEELKTQAETNSREREELNADKEEQEVLENNKDLDKPAIERNYYLDETIAIVVDYLKLNPELAKMR